jgi:hypothetical protein
MAWYGGGGRKQYGSQGGSSFDHRLPSISRCHCQYYTGLRSDLAYRPLLGQV